MADTEVMQHAVVPIEEDAEGIQGLRIAFVNVFGVTHGDKSWTLIDSGLPFSAGHIESWAEKHFDGPPLAIVLTHGHFDHVSGASALADKWNVPIYAHHLETPYLTGQKEYPAPDPAVGGGLMAILSPIYPRGPVNLGPRLQYLQADMETGGLDAMPGWQVIHTPGHTPGHISLFRAADRVLLAGDAFCTTKPESFFDAAITQAPELHGPPAYFTSDWIATTQSIHRLAQLQPRVLAPGHGRPLAGVEVERKFVEFAAAFGKDLSRKTK